MSRTIRYQVALSLSPPLTPAYQAASKIEWEANSVRKEKRKKKKKIDQMKRLIFIHPIYRIVHTYHCAFSLGITSAASTPLLCAVADLACSASHSRFFSLYIPLIRIRRCRCAIFLYFCAFGWSCYSPQLFVPSNRTTVNVSHKQNASLDINETVFVQQRRDVLHRNIVTIERYIQLYI